MLAASGTARVRNGTRCGTLSFVQETTATQNHAEPRLDPRRERMAHIFSALGAAVLVVFALVLLPAQPRHTPVQLTLVEPGWELRGRGAHGEAWSCTAELVGDSVWITAAHCVYEAVGALVLFQGDDVRQITQYKTAVEYRPGGKHAVRYDVAIVGAVGNVRMELRDVKDVGPDERIVVRSMQDDGLWHKCVVQRSDAYYRGGHWHIPCNLGHGASGSGVWVGGALVGVLSSVGVDGTNSIADPRDLYNLPY